MPPTIVIVARVHDLAEPALELESHHVCVEQRATGYVHHLAYGQRRGKQRAARMRERDEAHIVEIEGMRRDTISKRRPARARPDASSDNDATTLTLVYCDRLGGTRGWFDGSRERNADRVADRVCRTFQCRSRRLGARHELGEPFGIPHHQ